MPEESPKHDCPIVVDRFIDRIKNNRLAAALIAAALGIGALASLADSSRKLLDLLPAMGGVQAAGEWKSELAEFYPESGPEYMRLTLREASPAQILGTIQFGGNADSEPREFEVVDAKLAGSKLMLAFESGARTGPGGQAAPLRHTIMGELRGRS